MARIKRKALYPKGWPANMRAFLYNKAQRLNRERILENLSGDFPGLEHVPSPATRTFTEFSSEGPAHLEFGNISLTKGKPWVVKVRAQVPLAGSYLIADKFTNTSHSRWGLLADGRMFGLSDVSSNIDGDNSGFIGGNTIREYVAVSDGSRIVQTCNGSLLHEVAVGNSSPLINSAGRQYNGETGVPHLNGIFESLYIEVDGVAKIDLQLNDIYSAENNIVIDRSGNGNNAEIKNVQFAKSSVYQEGNGSGEWVSGDNTVYAAYGTA